MNPTSTSIDRPDVLSLFDAGPVVMFIWRNAPGWPIEFVSPNVFNLLGYQCEAFLSGQIVYADLIAPEHLKIVSNEVSEASNADVTHLQHAPYRLRHCEGHEVWVLDHTQIMRDASGQPLHYVGYLSDISAQKALEEENQRLVRGVENSAASIVITDSDGVIEYVNPAFTRTTGYGRDEVLGNNPRMLQSGETPLAVYQGMWQTLLAGRTWEGTLKNRRKDGQMYWEKANISPIRNSDGVITHFVAVKENISDRLAFESKLKESEENFRAFFDSIRDYLFVLDEAGHIIHANQSVFQHLDYSPESLLGRHVLDVHPPERREEAGRIVSEMLTGTTEQCPVPLRTREGRDIPVETRVVQGHWNGKPALFGVSRDLSSIKASEERFSKAFHLSPIAMALSDVATGRYYEVNAAFSRITGYAREEVIGRASSELGVFDPPEQRRALIDKLLREGDLRNEEVRIRTRQGDYRYGLFSGGVLGLQDQKILLTQMLDITDRKQSEQQMRLAANVFKHAHEGIMLCDANQIILDANPGFEAITGFSRAEALGKTPKILKSGRQLPEFYEAMWQSIKQQGYWHGEICNRHKNGEIYTELMTVSSIKDEEGRVTHYMGVFSDITLLKDHQERLELLAHYDALTRLPNRVLLADRLDQAIAQSRRSGDLLAVCYLDLDGFKPINDQYGHDAGDVLLIEIAHRIKDGLRGGDTVARLGGDEFVVLLSNIEDITECERAISRMLAAIALPVTIKGVEMGVSASIGVTLFPSDGGDPDTLLRHADQAMYKAKQSGRNRFHLYDPDQDSRARARREAIARIEHALENNEFRLHYQPKVDMRRGTVVGVEALIRWQHPERGLLPPAEFLPFVEEGELAIAIDRWVMREALRQVAKWLEQGHTLEMNINVSGSYLLGSGFITDLQGMLAQYPAINPGQVELEVLETVALEDMDQAGEVFAACHKLGVSIALDDFGTGYSSLTYFRRLPANTMKIDQSFVRDMLENVDDLAIVESVISLTHAFNRKLVAEGVETSSHGMVLLQMGCDVAQGYSIARPMPAADVMTWIGAFQPHPDWAAGLSWQWSKENIPLIVAESEHKRWVSKIEMALSNDMPAAGIEKEALSCRFGRWYHGTGKMRYGNSPSFIAIDPVHSRIHELGKQLLELNARGEHEAAMAGLHELHALRDELLSLVDNLMMGLDDLEM